MQEIPPKPHTQVRKIQRRDDGSISLTIEVFGFDEGTIVEVSGHATQANGAIATFYVVQDLPPRNDGGSLLTATSAPAAEFVAEELITVAGQARAVRLWGTVLDPGPGEGRTGVNAVWNARPET